MKRSCRFKIPDVATGTHHPSNSIDRFYICCFEVHVLTLLSCENLLKTKNHEDYNGKFKKFIVCGRS